MHRKTVAMTEGKTWDDLVAGRGCPFCAPREEKNEFSVRVKELSVSTLYLDRSQQYLGYCTLIFGARHATGLEQLADGEYKNFTDDLRHAAKAIFAAVKPDLMNYATLGNSIPHLHYHIIPRFKTDSRWRVNPFGNRTHTPFASEEEYDALAEKIRENL